jgi:hypothetical protein
MGFSPYGGMEDAMFSIIPAIIFLVFVFVIGAIIVNAIRGVGEWQKNNASPVLTVEAKVVTKRADISRHRHITETDNMNYVSSSTTYFVTFEVASGDRLEFRVSGKEYGMLVENDFGSLTFQGTRYLGFERSRG